MSARHGHYVVYHNEEYPVWRVFRNVGEIEKAKKSRNIFYKDKHILPNTIYIASCDRQDLNRGFNVFQDDKYGFVCLKNIKITEISRAYEYSSYAVYDGIRCEICEPSKNGKYFIQTYDDVCIIGESELLNKLKRFGFEQGYDMGHGMFLFEKYVLPNDPNLQIFEERTEIDINTL